MPRLAALAVVVIVLLASACGRTITEPPACVVTRDSIRIVLADTLTLLRPITVTACGFGR